MTDIVVLTGITGFLGGHIALELLKAGYTVRGSLRNPARADTVRQSLRAQGADTGRLGFVQLDLARDDGWEAALAGARFLLHTASPFVTTMPADKTELIRPAVDGTDRAVRAALKAGAGRIVMTSSTVAITAGRGRDRPGRLGADDWADPEGGRLNAYAESKTRAERHAWGLMQRAGRADGLAVINPGFIIGPLLDNDPGTSGALFQRFLRGGLPAVPRLFLHTVDVRDVARIHVAALEDPAAGGRRHPAAFSEMWLRDMAGILRRELPGYAAKIPRFVLPDWLVRIYGRFDGDIRANLNELGYNPRLDAERAQALLGRPPRPAAQSVREMAQGLIDRNLV